MTTTTTAKTPTPAADAYAAAGYDQTANWCDYEPMLASLGGAVAVYESDGEYQGDSYALLRDGARVGFLVFGWGSCSGCDALQDCDSVAELEVLRGTLLASVRWGSAAQTAALLRSAEREFDFYGGRAGWEAFRAKALAALAAEFVVDVHGADVLVTRDGDNRVVARRMVAEGPPQPALLSGKLFVGGGEFALLLEDGARPDPDVLEYVVAALREILAYAEPGGTPAGART